MKNVRAVQESTEDSIFEGTERKVNLKHLTEVAQRVHSVDEVMSKCADNFQIF